MIPATAPAHNATEKASHHNSGVSTPAHLLQLPITSLPVPGADRSDVLDPHILLSPPASTTATTSHLDDFTPRTPAGLAGQRDAITQHNLLAHGLNGHGSSLASQPAGLGLQIKTDLTPHATFYSGSLESDSLLRHSTSTASMPKRTPSIRAALHSTAGSLSPGSAFSSPQLAAMLNITPLPSPIELSKDPWRAASRTRSRKSSMIKSDSSHHDHSNPSSPPASPPKRKTYNGIRSTSGETQSRLSEVTDSDSSGHTRNRSTSDYIPEGLVAPKPRNVAVSINILKKESGPATGYMRREQYLAAQRGLTSMSPPIKSPSQLSEESGNGEDEPMKEPKQHKSQANCLSAESVTSGLTRKYKVIRQLGQGTFSKVYLAVRQVDDDDGKIDFARVSTSLDGVRARSRRLVAVKVVEQGAAGGADAARVEVSLRREIEVLKAVNHPSLVHLKAFGKEKSRSLLVLNYCQGGDLFEVASTQLDVLGPSLVRRIFAELVSAVRYLHQKYIVHRDIKLENVLLNIPTHLHSQIESWQTIDRAVITLTDLGLSRKIPEPPESPLLTTRCGSEDWAAPELLMGQPYDGRQTDAWALGVMLYTLMEGRLPFDPLPGARGDPAKLKARTPHRIARCEWAWCKLGDDDGEWDADKGKDYEGARPIVQGLLKRVSRRTGLEQIRETDWVKNGIVIDGGLRRVEEEAL